MQTTWKKDLLVQTTCSESQDLRTLAGGGPAGSLGAGLEGPAGADGGEAAKGTSMRYTFFSQASTRMAEGARLPHTTHLVGKLIAIAQSLLCTKRMELERSGLQLIVARGRSSFECSGMMWQVESAQDISSVAVQRQHESKHEQEQLGLHTCLVLPLALYSRGRTRQFVEVNMA